MNFEQMDLQDLFNFDVRAGRVEFVVLSLLSWFLVIPLSFLTMIMGPIGIILLFVGLIGCAALNVAVTIRRLHDLNFSGLWYIGIFAILALGCAINNDGFAAFINMCLMAIYLFLCIMPGTNGGNKYGSL